MEISPYSRVCKNLDKTQYFILSSISKYVNSPIYFYGSCIRDDFVKRASDVDSIIFTENIDKTTSLIEEKIKTMTNGITSYKVIKLLMDTYGTGKDVTSEYLFRIHLTTLYNIDLIVCDMKYKNRRLMHDYYVSSKINSNPIFPTLLYITKVLYYYGFINYDTYMYVKRLTTKRYSKTVTVMEIKPSNTL